MINTVISQLNSAQTQLGKRGLPLRPEDSIEVLGGPERMSALLVSLDAEALGGVLEGLR